MAKHTSTQNPDLEMLTKKEVESMREAYECLKPLIEMLQKGKGDFGKTVRSREAGKFWETIRNISKEHDQLAVENHPLQDPPKQGETEQKWQAGGRVRDERVEKDKEPAKKSRPDNEGQTDAGNRGGSAGTGGMDTKSQSRAADLKSSSQGHQGNARSPPTHSTTINVAVSSASNAPKPNFQKNVESADTVNQGPAPITQQDKKDVQKLADDRLEQLEDMEKQNIDLEKQKNAQIDQLQKEISSLKSNLNDMEEKNNVLTNRYEEGNENLRKKIEDCNALTETRNEHLNQLLNYEKALKKNEESIEERDRTIMTLAGDLEKLNKEYNDVKSRFSKLAGDKLTDQNPDIADLSDPNRAMKLSEKFGALYDDAWTDAFEYLTDKKKQKPKDAIQYLLQCLKECWGLCQKEAATWMNSLQQVFLYPVQDTEAISKMQGGKAAVRLGSKDLRVIRDACRKIAPTVGIFVKQCFIMQMKKNQKFTDECLTYLEGCVDVCWLMVLAEPPLHIEFNIKPGDKFDTNRHVAYQASGEKIEFLVWPPLYNALEGGGMLSKGTVSTERKIEKPSKK